MDWACTTIESTVFDPESTLEQRFRAVFGKRLKAVGATVKETPTNLGNRLTITLGGSGRVWTVEPQQFIAGCKPDFVLRCTDGAIPEIAVFTDGWRWHASPAINRLADDARKREVLRGTGRVVLGITWEDLEAADTDTVTPPSWYDPGQAAEIMRSSGGALSSASLDLITGGPVDFLIGWIQDPQPAAVQRLANWLPTFLLGSAQHRSVVGEAGPSAAAAGVLDATTPIPVPGALDWVWSDDTVALATQGVDNDLTNLSTALLLDDRPQRVGLEHKDAWRNWLRIGNLLNLRTRPSVITTWTRVHGEPTAASEQQTPAGTLSADWQGLWENGTALERGLILALAQSGVALPTQGDETPEGIVLSLCWPEQHVAIDFDYSAEDRHHLEPTWRLAEPTVDAVLQALSAETA